MCECVSVCRTHSIDQMALEWLRNQYLSGKHTNNASACVCCTLVIKYWLWLFFCCCKSYQLRSKVGYAAYGGGAVAARMATRSCQMWTETGRVDVCHEILPPTADVRMCRWQLLLLLCERAWVGWGGRRKRDAWLNCSQATPPHPPPAPLNA